MRAYFVNFIRAGDPNGSGLPRWPVGVPTHDGTVQRLRFGRETAAEFEPTSRYLFLDSFLARSRP